MWLFKMLAFWQSAHLGSYAKLYKFTITKPLFIGRQLDLDHITEMGDKMWIDFQIAN